MLISMYVWMYTLKLNRPCRDCPSAEVLVSIGYTVRHAVAQATRNVSRERREQCRLQIVLHDPLSWIKIEKFLLCPS